MEITDSIQAPEFWDGRGTNRTLKETLQEDQRLTAPGGFVPNGSAQTQDDPTVTWLFSFRNCVWEAPSHNKTGLNNFASGKGR